MEQSKKTSIIFYLLFFLISFLFLLIHSENTSPLFEMYGGDSANYLMMGKMLLHGKIPFIDFFDHKGPMMIFIEAFGQILIEDRLGIFILQIFTLTISLSLIYNIAKLFVLRAQSILVIISVILFFFIFTIQGGNMTEEYSQPFLLYSLYIALKVLLDKKIKKLDFLLMGICAAFLIWIRLNNTGAALASVLFIFIVYLKNKEYKYLGHLILYYGIGFALVSICLLSYFYFNDAIYEMFFAAFIYNLKYVGINESPSPYGSIATTLLHLLKAWGPFIVLAVGTLLYYFKINKNYKILLLSLLLLIIGYASTHVGAAYYHYMTLNMSSLLLGCIYLSKIFFPQKSKIESVVLVILILIILLFSVHRYHQSSQSNVVEKYYNALAEDVVNKIPSSERNSIYAYQTMTKFHAASHSVPCFKYFMMQEWQSQYNPQMRVETNLMMRENSPKWLITQFRDQSTNDEFWVIVNEKYELYYKNDLFELFKLK